VFIEDVKKRMLPRWEFDAQVHDMLDGPVAGNFDAVYSLDVLEHIEPSKEKLFLKNHRTAVTGEPALCLDPVEARAHQLQIGARPEEADGGILPQRLHLQHERRGSAYRLPQDGQLRFRHRCRKAVVTGRASLTPAPLPAPKSEDIAKMTLADASIYS
jgi:hypothetical protein